MLEKRTRLVAHKVWEYLKATDPTAKTIVFCDDQDHAERMRQELVKVIPAATGNRRYVMRITGDDNEGKAQLTYFIDNDEPYPVIATTSKLLTTGVDAKTCKLIMLDQNINSMTEFKLVNRDFRSAAPNQKWLTNITEFQNPAGKVYLSPIIDCFDGLVVGWSLGTSPDAELVNTARDTAIETIANGSDRPIVHSDRGGHYRWPGWLSRINNAALVRSMLRKACSPDNAACDGFFGRLKNELFYPRSWQNTTIEHFIAEVDSYIRWYNEERIKISLGSRSPMEYRADLGYAT